MKSHDLAVQNCGLAKIPCIDFVVVVIATDVEETQHKINEFKTQQILSHW